MNTPAKIVAIAIPIFFILATSTLAQERGWKIKWEETVAAAKKEGQVNLYVRYASVLEAGVFQKAFQGIKVNVVTGRGANLIERIMAERRAGKFLADIVMEGVTTTHAVFHRGKMLAPVRPALILPEVVDESNWWGGKHRYYDSEGEYVFIFVGMPLGMVYRNSNLVNPADFKSLWDFVNPKWKGKIVARDVRVPGPGGGSMRFFYHHPDLGPKFIRQLFGQMDTAISRDFRQVTDWLAIGKYAICFFCNGVDIEKAKSQGLPVDAFSTMMKEGEGLVAQSGSLGLMSLAPHPNAAKVFLNWFLSREGQITVQRTVGKDSLRTDIPKDDLLPGDRRVLGANYMDMETLERSDMVPVLKVFEEALAEARARGQSVGRNY